MMDELLFEEFQKIARLNREMIVTEKIDGTNAQIYITETVGTDGTTMRVGSRTRWLDAKNDNHGFHKWAMEHAEELMKLGPGRHYGEWWGSGIQRGYGQKTGKYFSLFNTSRWSDGRTGDRYTLLEKNVPDCVSVVPVLYKGPFDTHYVADCVKELREHGSSAAPGFMKPEGVVIYHVQGNLFFKVTIEKDELPKSVAHAA